MQLLKIFDSFLSSNGIERYQFPVFVSPIQHLKNLSKMLNHPIYIKRDDLNEIGLGGNKLRKLAYLMAEAISQSANRIVTVGALQSNHARLTAFVARMLNLEIDLVLKKSVHIDLPNYNNNGNILLNNLIDAHLHKIPNDERASSYIENLLLELKNNGDRPYFIPVGGSNALGSIGYARAAVEIEEQIKQLGIDIDHIAVASGSGGTHAGLLAGYNYLNKHMRIQAYNVQPEREPLYAVTKALANEVSILLHCKQPIAEEQILLSNDYAGEDYGIPNGKTIATIKLLAKTEGILIDPVYTAKAFTGFIEDIRSGKKIGAGSLFIHTGGIPGIFAYEDSFKVKEQ